MTNDARYARSLSLSDLFVYLRAFYVRGILFRMKRVARFCVAAFASDGFFSLSSSLLRALFVVLSLLEKEMGEERNKLRAICLISSERKTRKCAMKEKRGSPSSNIKVARYDGAFCVLSSAYCGLGRRFMHRARRKTTKETYFGCLTDHEKKFSSL